MSIGLCLVAVYTHSLTQEIHIMHPFSSDFYGHHMKVVILGYIRPELDYISRGASVTRART